MTIEAADGRRYLDCLSGTGTPALGHNHPVVLEAIRAELDAGGPRAASPSAEAAFTAELLRGLPPGLAEHARVRFCGATRREAVTAALDLLRAATGRTAVLALADAHHGTASGPSAPSAGIPGAPPTRLPYPDDYRCPFGVGGRSGGDLALRRAAVLLEAPGAAGPPAALIVETVPGGGGVVPAPDGWLRRLRELTALRGVPLVVDESETGAGRTGALWGIGHSGIVPEVLVLSEAVGGGLPLAAVVHHAALAPPEPHAGPAAGRGNRLAMAAGAAMLGHVRRERLAERAVLLGERMLRRLREAAAGHACVGDVRGRGLMLAIELVDPGAGAGDLPARPPAPGLAAAVRQHCLRRGLLVAVDGPHGSVVRLQPPLTVTDEQAEAVLERLSDALAAAVRESVPSRGADAAGAMRRVRGGG